jgi:NADPH:quinone reductase-like Zn-dependent oxidoreductase
MSQPDWWFFTGTYGLGGSGSLDSVGFVVADQRESSGLYRAAMLLAAAGCRPTGLALCHTSCVRAIVLNSFTGLDGLELAQIPDPVPRDGEQLVKVRAASLGPWDRYSTEGAFVAMGGSSEFPQVQGWDFAGETIDGGRVLGFVPQPWMGVGAFAEQIAVPSAILAPLPDAVGFPEGSTLPVCGLTARLLVEAAAVSGGDVVLVTGAAGMVGGFAVQLARGRGAQVIAAVREREAGEARRLGAEAVMDTGTELEAAVRRQWPNGVDACLDTAGLGSRGLGCVCDGGAFVTSVTTVPGAVPDPARGISPRTVAVQPDADATAELADVAAQGELTLRVAETVPLERFRDAYLHLERGGLPGKIVLTP